MGSIIVDDNNIPKMVWMEVDLKMHELPLKVADSPIELAEMCGVAESTVITTASRAKKKKQRFVKVWIDGV